MRPRIRFLDWLLLACALARGLWPVDAVATTTEAAYAVATIDRYLPIVSRMPFGAPPPHPPATSVVPESAASATASDLGKNCVMSFLARTPAEEILVGFTDNAVKPPRNLLLAVGEEGDGYKVLAADFDHETATLEKDGTRFELRLNAGPRAPAAVYAADFGGAQIGSIRLSTAGWAQLNAPGAAGASAPARPAADTTSDDPETSRGNSNVLESYAASVRARRERLMKLNEDTLRQREQAAAEQQQAAAAKEAAAKAQREANLNLLRKGLKPQEPITLTPEEDAKLVSEGVLAPP